MEESNSEEVSEFLTKLLKLRWLSKKHLAEELSDYQLTPSQYITLRALEAYPQGLSMSDLAKTAHHVSATVSGIVDRMESQALVERFQNTGDRRRIQVKLTDHGINLLERITAAKKVKFKQILDQLTPEQRVLLNTVIDMASTYLQSNLRG
jgi:DNA-binding MarR family transcriptional regulator